jgi:hypothetical protein
LHRWLSAVVAGTVFGGIAVLNAAGSHIGDQDLVLVASRAPSKGKEHYSFVISGSSTKPLYPGVMRRIKLTFSNPYPSAIRLDAVTGRIVSTSRRRCAPTRINLEVRKYQGQLPVTVAPKSRRSAGYVELHMPNSVANACQGATFRIAFAGEATKAAR